jgi:hypothetical protein
LPKLQRFFPHCGRLPAWFNFAGGGNGWRGGRSNSLASIAASRIPYERECRLGPKDANPGRALVWILNLRLTPIGITSDNPNKSRLKGFLSFGCCFSLCPAPSIGVVDGYKRANCLSEASFRVLRPPQPVDAASVVLAGKASCVARRAAIFRL